MLGVLRGGKAGLWESAVRRLNRLNLNLCAMTTASMLGCIQSTT